MNNNIDSPLSDSNYYSPNNSENESDALNIESTIKLIDNPKNSDSISYDIDSTTNLFTSPKNNENKLESPLFIDIIDCYCLNKEDSCLIFCFNADTNQFENMDCI